MCVTELGSACRVYCLVILVEGGLDLFSVFHLVTCILKRIGEKVAVVRRCLVNKPVVERFVQICMYRDSMKV